MSVMSLFKLLMCFQIKRNEFNISMYFLSGRWVSLGTPVSSTNKTDLHNIAEILLKVALNTVNQTKPSKFVLEKVMLYTTISLNI